MRLKLLLIGLGAAFLLITGFSPGALPFNPGARFSDSVTAHWNAALFFRKSVLDRHEFPLWRETIMAGAPFAANPLNKTAYPLQWLALALPPALHLDTMIVLHLLIAGGGMWRWARSLGIRPEAAGLSALAYSLAPRVIGHTGAGHLDLLYALAWFPWLMEAVKVFTSTVKVNWKNVAWITLAAALVFLADTRLSLFAFVTAAAYGLYEVAQGKGWSRFGWIIPALFLFVLLTVSLTVPLLGWSPYLSRSRLTPQEAGVFSLEPAHLVGLILPAQGGNIETLTYVGLPVLALAGVALVTMPRKLGFWLVVICLAALYALGQNGILWSLLVRFVPGLLWFRVPSRVWFMVALVSPLLAGYGLEWLMERAGERNPRRWLLYVFIGLIASLACGLSVIARLPLPDAAGWSVIVGGGGLALVVFAGLNGWLSARGASLLILIAVFADLLITGRSWLEWRGENEWLTPYEPLAAVLIEDGAARVYSPTYSLPQQVAEAYDLRLFGGVDPFQLEHIVDAVAHAGGIEPAGYSVVVPPLNDIEGNDPATANRSAVPNTELLAEWEVSHVVAAYPIEHPRLQIVDEIASAYVYRNLDYGQTTSMTVPNWSTNSPALPDRATLARLNQWTLATTLISGITLLISVLILLKPKR
jgi:hypothetical protein